MDLTTLDDDALDDLRREVLIEQERRANLALIPEQIAAMARTYREGGGDEQELTDALSSEEAAPDDAAAEHFDYLDEETI